MVYTGRPVSKRRKAASPGRNRVPTSPAVQNVRFAVRFFLPSLTTNTKRDSVVRIVKIANILSPRDFFNFPFENLNGFMLYLGGTKYFSRNPSTKRRSLHVPTRAQRVVRRESITRNPAVVSYDFTYFRPRRKSINSHKLVVFVV